MPARAKNFVSLVSFKKYAKNNGLRVKKTTVAKKNVYYMALHPVDGVVGHFNERPNTNRGTGRIDAF